LDYQDKDERLMTKNAEMIWHGSANLGKWHPLIFKLSITNLNFQERNRICLVALFIITTRHQMVSVSIFYAAMPP